MGTQSIIMGSSQTENPLDMAGKMVDHFLRMDSSAPQLVDLLRISSSGPTVSGLQDIDYPVLTSPGAGSLNQHSIMKRVPLPGELVEQFGHMQCNCMMGLFPEIGRAWLTIDSDIFVWTYSNGSDLAYFNGLSETILSVALVKPKKGIFRSHIHYLLCLATPVEIVLLGVSFSRSDEDDDINYLTSEMHLLPEPLFFLPSDNCFFLTIVGINNGRIFMGSKSGCLYELVYQAEDGWFSRKCRKVNHSSSSLSFLIPSFLNFGFSEEDPIVQITVDNSRKILYTRSEKGTIQVFDLGTDGKSMSRVTFQYQQTIVQDAAQAARTIDRSNFKPIVHIAAIESQESLHLHLVAVTHTGVRLYFTTTHLNNPLTRPFTLQLLHIRLPPGLAANALPQCPNKVHMAHYKKGTLLLVSSQSEENDFVWTISSDTFPFHQQLMETQNVVPLDGKSWALAEVPGINPLATSERQQTDPPLVVTQHVEVPRQFVFLTPQGCHIITHMRPVDQLRQLLTENLGPDCEVVKNFFSLHQEDQACASCLILACSTSPQDLQVAEWAARAFFLYGGDPLVRYPTAYNTMPPMSPSTVSGFMTPTRFQPQQVSTPNPPFQTSSLPQAGASSPYLGDASQQSVPGTPGFQQQSQSATFLGPEIQFSGKHNGLYIYLSRILRPLWDYPIIADQTVETSEGDVNCLISTVTGDELDYFQKHLSALKEFLEKFAHIKLSSTTERSNQSLPQRVRNFLLPDSLSTDVGQMQQQLQKKSQVEAQLQEKSSLINLQQLIARVWEIIGLWKILVDHHFHDIARSLSKDYRNQLRSMTFREFVISGKEMANTLVTALINRYLGDNATTDAISNRLRDVCPSIYKTEDAVSAKAIEMLLSARQIQNVHEKEKLLHEALQLAKQITLQLNIPIICSYFQYVHCYSGIIELCLTAASQRDPQGISLQFYRNGEPQEDQQGYQVYASRMDCYKVILSTLEQLMNISLSHPKSPSVPKLPGPPPPSDPNTLSPTEASEYWNKTFHLVLKSDDELAHVALYKWLIGKKLIEKLLEVRSVFLENYLIQTVNLKPDKLEILDLLWKFYEKSRNYSSAARILKKLSERQGDDIDLQQRIEYLSRASMCIKSSEVRTTLSSEGEFLQELEEKLEVSRIQLQILDVLSRMPPTQDIKDAIRQLNSGLLDISVLYQNFAETFNLNECKLAIIHCANHYDPTLVEALWQSILEKEFSSTIGSSPDVIVARVFSKVKALGTVYFSSQKYFPVAFLIKYLEQESARLNLNHSWVFTVLSDIGVPFSQLLDIYSKLYKLKDPVWPSLKKPLHLLSVIAHLIGSFADSILIVPHQERRHLIVVCLDCVASYLVDLQVLGPAANISVRELMDEFKAIQAKLERMT